MGERGRSLVSVRNIEQRTALNFFPDLTPAQSTQLEGTALTATAWQNVLAPRCETRQP